MNKEVKSFAVSVGKVSFKIGKDFVKSLKSESKRYYALLKPVSIMIVGKNAGGIDWSNDVFEIDSIGNDAVMLTVQPFSEDTHYWNGPSVIDDIDDGRIEASLFHDLIWEWSKDIAQDNNLTNDQVLTWSNKLLAVIWRAYADKKGKLNSSVKFKSWCAANVCNCVLAKLWKRIVSIIAITFLVTACDACLSIPDWDVETDTIEMLTPEQIKDIQAKKQALEEQQEAEPPAEDASTPTEDSSL